MKNFFFIFIFFPFSFAITQTEYILPQDFPNLSYYKNELSLNDNLFLSSYSMDPLHDRNFLIILNNNGEVEFFKKMHMPTMDFKVQENGLLSYLSPKYPNWNWIAYSMDSTYSVVDSFEVAGSSFTDSHDFLMLNNGNYILLGGQWQFHDMTYYGGLEFNRIEGCVIQEFNSQGTLLFDWNSFDHFNIEDVLHYPLNVDGIDYVHANSIEIDHDNNLLLSSRHLCEITKIDRNTGEIIWRLGGVNNEFEFTENLNNGHTPPQPFCRQHDVRVLDNGNITFFDNGNDKNPRFSRIVEYSLDEVNKVAELVWEYRDTLNFSGFLGNVQKLSNDNYLTIWNQQDPNLSTLVQEISQDNTIAMQIELPLFTNTNDAKVGDFSYRVFKNSWIGKQEVPSIWSDTINNNFSLNFTQFGEDNIDKYYIYSGNELLSLTKIDSTVNTRYSIEYPIYGIEQIYAVSSKNNNSSESDLSKLIRFTSYKLFFGDTNYDSKIDIIDILNLYDMINGDIPLILIGDYNQDSFINIQDIEEIILFLTLGF